MKIFVINLDRRQDRFEYMKKHLEFHGISSFEKISAIDYKNFVSLDENNQEYIDYEKINKTDLLENIKTKYFCPHKDQYQLSKLTNYDKENHLLSMSLPEVCVAKSHKKVWKEAMNYDYSLILEDDITFTSRIQSLLDYIENQTEINFDIYLLGWLDGYAEQSLYVEDVKFEYPLKKIKYALCLHSYVLTKDMAKRLYESTIQGPIDEYMALLYKDINCYGTHVSIQTETDIIDNIHSSKDSNKRLII